jgi:hypothetical protein
VDFILVCASGSGTCGSNSQQGEAWMLCAEQVPTPNGSNWYLLWSTATMLQASGQVDTWLCVCIIALLHQVSRQLVTGQSLPGSDCTVTDDCNDKVRQFGFCSNDSQGLVLRLQSHALVFILLFGFGLAWCRTTSVVTAGILIGFGRDTAVNADAATEAQLESKAKTDVCWKCS